jgi:hypothetical protein
MDRTGQAIQMGRTDRTGRTGHMDQTDQTDQTMESYKFRLGAQKEDFIYEPAQRTYSFYQICQFPVKKKYMVRKIIYDQCSEMLTYTEKSLDKKTLDRFINGCQKYKYTIYPAYNLDVVGFPEPNEILTAGSHILNGI